MTATQAVENQQKAFEASMILPEEVMRSLLPYIEARHLIAKRSYEIGLSHHEYITNSIRDCNSNILEILGIKQTT